jgi:hypothetical protein
LFCHRFAAFAEDRAAIYIAFGQFNLLFNWLGAGSAAVFVLLCFFFRGFGGKPS